MTKQTDSKLHDSTEQVTLFNAVLSTAIAAAKKAGAYIKESHQKRDVTIQLKDRTNLVTQYDLGSEKIIIDIVKDAFPEHELLTEETNSEFLDIERLKKPIWIIDPIDGTTNFAHGHYQVSVSIGFAIDGVVSVGTPLPPYRRSWA